ncbi:MAG: hypothetical protein QME66_10925 [Candidatus Eisenbacteria bacterium]|nr:hypothetical protein [Candidatus Eisenbacteria bacterium]
MKLVVASIVAALLAFSSLPAFAVRDGCYPGAGIDCYTASFSFIVAPIGMPESAAGHSGSGSPSQDQPFPVELSGTLGILRSPGFFDQEAGKWAVNTELMSLDMSGFSGEGDVIRAILDYSRRSFGTIMEIEPGTCFPAESFFDIFFEFQVYNPYQGHFTVTSEEPFMFYAVINEVPIEVGAQFGLRNYPFLWCSWLEGMPCAQVISGVLTLTGLIDCEPLPTAPSTWGRVKAMYR